MRFITNKRVDYKIIFLGMPIFFFLMNRYFMQQIFKIQNFVKKILFFGKRSKNRGIHSIFEKFYFLAGKFRKKYLLNLPSMVSTAF